MNNRFTFLRVLALLVLFANQAFAQFSLDAEFRPRSEFRQGFNQPLADDLKASWFTTQRTRLNFTHKSEWLNTRISVQNTRIFGESTVKQVMPLTTESFGLFEAWAELKLFADASLKIGRQGIQIDDGRLFGLGNWSLTGNSHDLALFRIQKNDSELRFAYAYGNQLVLNADTMFYSVRNMYKQLVLIHLTQKIGNHFNLSLLFSDESFEKSKTDLDFYHRYTSGGTLSFSKLQSTLSASFGAFYQFGKSKAELDLDAFLLALKTKYTVNTRLSTNFGTDYYSGSKTNLAASKTNTFNKLPYGVNHSFNGFMQYWVALPKGGLIDYYGGLNWIANEKLNFELTFHSFRLAQEMKFDAGKTARKLGSEADLVMNYQPSSNSRVQFGWCTYLVNDGTRLLKNQPQSGKYKFPQYAYLMLTINPVFFTSK